MNSRENALANELLEVQRTLGWMDLVIGSIEDAVYVLDDQSRIVFANQFFSDILNVPRIFLLGQTISDVFDVKLDKKMTAESIYEKDDTNGLAAIYTWKTIESKHTFRISKKYIQTTNQTVCLAKDITREQELLVMKNNFINLASHQLRTPMTSIMLYSHILSDLLEDSDVPSKPKEIAETIAISAKRMTRLIDDILNITRIQNEALYKSNLELVNLNNILGIIQKDVADQLKNKRINLSVKISPALPIFKCDRNAIHEIISNLITNAVQYTPDSGKITVSAELDKGSIIITVKDTGIGIPAHAVNQIYDQFARADNAFAVFNEGTGLGLYLVKLLLTKIGGSIECASRINKGTTFTVRIPYIQ